MSSTPYEPGAGVKFKSAADLVAEMETGRSVVPARDCYDEPHEHYADKAWEDWQLCAGGSEPTLHNGGYWFSLTERGANSARLLDIIFQAGEKQPAGLIEALRDILHPQANLCSFGRGTKLSASGVREQVRRLTAGWPHYLG